MTKQEKDQILREAVLSLEPNKIREAGERTGHPVKLESDLEILLSAAEMIIFFIPDAPQNIMNKALSLITLRRINISNLWGWRYD